MIEPLFKNYDRLFQSVKIRLTLFCWGVSKSCINKAACAGVSLPFDFDPLDSRACPSYKSARRERVKEKLSLIGLHSQGHLSSMCSGWLHKSGADQKGIIKTWLHFPRGPIQTAMLSYSVATNGLQTIDSPSGEIGYFSLYSSGRFRGGKPTIRIKKWSIMPEDSLKCSCSRCKRC